MPAASTPRAASETVMDAPERDGSSSVRSQTFRFERLDRRPLNRGLFTHRAPALIHTPPVLSIFPTLVRRHYARGHFRSVHVEQKVDGACPERNPPCVNTVNES